MNDWEKDKQQKRLDKQWAKLRRSLATPVPKGEMLSANNALLQHVMSVAIGLEALETILVEKGILTDNQLMDRAKEIAAAKAEQVEAAQATETPGNSLVTLS